MTIFAKKIGYMHKRVQSKNINFRLGSVDWLTWSRTIGRRASEDWLTGVGKYFMFVTKTFCVNCKVVRCVVLNCSVFASVSTLVKSFQRQKPQRVCFQGHRSYRHLCAICTKIQKKRESHTTFANFFKDWVAATFFLLLHYFLAVDDVNTGRQTV